MKKTRIFFLLFMGFSFLWGTTLNAEQVMILTELLEKAEKDLYDYAAPWELMEPESCKDIKRKSDTSLHECVLILKDTNIPILRKHILINILNWDMEFIWYKEFLYNLSKEYEKGKIDDEIIIESFINIYSDHIIAKNYKDKIIKDSINICLSKKGNSNNIVNFFTNLKNGKTWRNYQWQIFLKKIGFIESLS